MERSMIVSTPRLLVLGILGFAPLAAVAADCNGNGTPDFEEIRSGALPDCNANGVPDGCDIAPVNYGLVSSGSFFVGQQPSDFVIDDLDADGDTDIAAGSGTDESVALLWNDGKGRFASPARWSTGQVTTRLVAGDLDRDGWKDLAVAGSLGLGVLFQTPERRFVARAPTVAIEPRIQSLAGGDLDGDSDIDLAAAVSFGVRILRNEGTGAFSPLDTMPIGSDPIAIIAANLDGDADIDLATTNGMATPFPTGNVSILINKGDGSFDTARNFATGPNPMALTAGDLDGDGDADLATANRLEGQITILVGDGRGRFTKSTELETGKQLQALTSADVDGDGDLDLAASGLEVTSAAGVALFLNHGGAEFARPVEFEIGFAPFMIRPGDIDGDRSVDLVVSDINVAAVTVLQGSRVAYATDCNSNLLPDDCELEGNDCNGNELPDGCDVASRESADCDRDGRPDECQPDCNGNTIADSCDIASGFASDCNRNGSPDDCDIRGAGLGFETTFLKLEIFTRLLASSDLDADGLDDLYALDDTTNLVVFWNGGPEGFPRESRFAGGSKVTDIVAGDLDGDSDREILLADAEIQGLRVMENRGDRTFGEGTKLPVPVGVNVVSVADLDGDLDLDLAMTTFEGNVAVAESRGGVIAEPLNVGGPVSSRMLELADLDGDGRPDLLTDAVSQDAVLLFWNAGSLAFQGPTVLGPRFFVQALAVVDADDDGDMDIYLSTDRIVLFRNRGGRIFTPEDSIPSTMPGASGMLPGDLDLDGDQDLAVIFQGFQLAALLNRGDGAFDLPVGLPAFANSFNFPASGDWNGDGAMDLAILQSFFCADCPIPLLPPPPPNDGPQLLILTNVSRPPVSRDADLNGVPDECQQRPFHRGDSNGDGIVNLTDAVFTLGHLFRGERAPACLEAADANNDARLEITDPIATLEFLFRGGTPPASPGPPPAPCGLDTDASGSAGDIGCGAYESCGV